MDAGGLIGGLTTDAWGLVCGQLGEVKDLVAVSGVCRGLARVARGHRVRELGVVLVRGDVTRGAAAAWPHLPLVNTRRKGHVGPFLEDSPSGGYTVWSHLSDINRGYMFIGSARGSSIVNELLSPCSFEGPTVQIKSGMLDKAARVQDRLRLQHGALEDERDELEDLLFFRSPNMDRDEWENHLAEAEHRIEWIDDEMCAMGELHACLMRIRADLLQLLKRMNPGSVDPCYAGYDPHLDDPEL